MKLRSSLLGLALAVGLGLAASACGGDNPYVPSDGQGSGSGSGSGSGAATFTSYVIDLITNHSSDQTPASYADFKDLPDPDGDNNNGSAYDSLFQ